MFTHWGLGLEHIFSWDTIQPAKGIRKVIKMWDCYMTPHGQFSGLLEIQRGEGNMRLYKKVVECGLGHWTAWLQALTLLLHGCAPLRKSLNLSVPQCVSSVKWGYSKCYYDNYISSYLQNI